jgi:hypothetical protein
MYLPKVVLCNINPKIKAKIMYITKEKGIGVFPI